MLRLALTIWLGLICYKLYDYWFYQKTASTSTQPLSSPVKENIIPRCNEDWEGFEIIRNKPERIDTQLK